MKTPSYNIFIQKFELTVNLVCAALFFTSLLLLSSNISYLGNAYVTHVHVEAFLELNIAATRGSHPI